MSFPCVRATMCSGVLEVGPRPGEHYAAEERELIGHVAHAVGALLFALRARATEEALQITEEQLPTARAEAAAQVDQAHVQRRASEARESKLIDALRSLGVEPKVSTDR